MEIRVPQTPQYSIDDRRPQYLVRIWIEPEDPREARSMSDRIVTGAESVVDALEWAREYTDGRSYELLARLDEESVWVRLVGDSAVAGERMHRIDLVR